MIMVAKKAKKEVKVENAGKAEIDSGKTLAAVSYLWIAGLIILLTEKKNKFTLFHAKQATGLFIVETIASISVILSPLGIIGGIVSIVWLVFALQGKMTKLPWMYELGDWTYNLFNKK